MPQTDKNGRRTYPLNKNQNGLRRSEEVVYYVSSRKLDAKKALTEVRKHWGIENKLHWVLDVAFGEDDWLTRNKSLARSRTMIRKIGLNMLRKNKSEGSIRKRMKRSAWNDSFLEEVVFGKRF